MKNLYLLITLFILVACGPKNLFDGTYEGYVSGNELNIVIQADKLTMSGDIPSDVNCSLEDPTTTITAFSCEEFELSGPASIDGDTLTLSPEGEEVGIFERIK